MVLRTGKPSDKMLLQEVLSNLLKQPKPSLQDFILQTEVKDIHLLFNQQSTGRISGITYYHSGLRFTGQKLGNRFKWAELIKQLNYEQIRDSKAISEVKSRTKQFTEASQEQKSNQALEQEVTDFIEAMHQVLQISIDSRQQMRKLEMRLTEIEKGHWRQVRMLIVSGKKIIPKVLFCAFIFVNLFQIASD